VILAASASGCVRLTVVVAVAPFASVTVTVYVVLAARFVAVATALPFDHRYVFIPTPPVLDAVADPVLAPRQVMCVDAVMLAKS
jgi:hypothetical protein